MNSATAVEVTTASQVVAGSGCAGFDGPDMRKQKVYGLNTRWADAIDRLFFLNDRRILWLDGLRAMAIILVVARHVYDRPYDKIRDNIGAVSGDIFVKLMAYYSWSGVQLFFIISGFLVGGQVILDIRSRNFAWKKFFVGRFFKTYVPAMIFAIAAAWGALPAPWGVDYAGGYLEERSINNYLFLTNYTGDAWQPHYWSLAVEEHFYLVMPIIALGLAPFARVASLRVVAQGLLAFVVIFATAKILLAQTSLVSSAWQYHAQSHWQLDFFAMGAALRLYHESGLSVVRSGRLQNSAILITAVICFLLIGFYSAAQEFRGLSDPRLGVSSKGVVQALTLILFGCGAWIVGNYHDIGVLFSKRWMRIAAVLTFSTYIVHLSVLENSVFLYSGITELTESQSVAYLLALVIGLVTSFGFGFVFFVLVERPILLLRRRILRAVQ